MVLNQSFCFCFSIVFLFLFLGLPASSSSPTFISDGVFESQASIGRNLLQAKKGCPVNFEFFNYTVITSQCKGPQYPAKQCCDAFKELACPYADVINDLTNECASIMFSYINLYGNYPPGLFANECHDGKEGLICPALPPSAVANDAAPISLSAALHCSLTPPSLPSQNNLPSFPLKIVVRMPTTLVLLQMCSNFQQVRQAHTWLYRASLTAL